MSLGQIHNHLISMLFLAPLGGHNLKQTEVCYSDAVCGAKNVR